MKHAAALFVLLASCASPSRDEPAAAYTISLTLLDASAAVLLRDRAALEKQLTDTFTLNDRPWPVDPLLEAIRRAVRKIRVIEAHFVSHDGQSVDVPLTFVEPDAELVKLFRRQPPHDAIEADERALTRVGIQREQVYGRARCWLVGEEPIEVDFVLELRVTPDAVRIQSLRFTRR